MHIEQSYKKSYWLERVSDNLSRVLYRYLDIQMPQICFGQGDSNLAFTMNCPCTKSANTGPIRKMCTNITFFKTVTL